ncbi:MAG: cadherin domain-containing protein [Sphingobium sp.]
MAYSRSGSEFLVNTQTALDQMEPAITGLAGGGFVVTWRDESGIGDDTSAFGIKAQIHDAAGARIGGEFLVNSETANPQAEPAITALVGGGFVVSWTDFSGVGGDASASGVKAQIYDATGARVGGEFLINTQTTSQQVAPSITGLASGGFVVSWADFSQSGGDTSGYGIKAQIYDATGARIGGEFLVNTQVAGWQLEPAVASLANGGFVTSWSDANGDGSGYGIKAQIHDATGARIGGEFLVNTQKTGFQTLPTITGLTNGGFVIAWSDGSGDASGQAVKAQVYDAAGARIGGEILVNTQTTGWQFEPSITSLATGGFILSWTDESGIGDDASNAGVKAQIFSATGTRIGDEFLVNSKTDFTQAAPTITDLADGGFVVSWRDFNDDGTSYNIKAQVYQFVNEAPGAISVTPAAVDEHAPVGTAVGIASAVNLDGDTLSWSLEGADAALFAIDAAPGVITTAAVFDHEASASYDITVKATDADGLSSSAALAITIGDVNEAPVLIGIDTVLFNEGAPAGTLVGTASAGDVDGDTLSWSLGGTDAGLFQIDTATGTVTTKSDLAAVAGGQYSVTIRATDGGGLFDEQTISLTVNNRPAAAGDSLALDENAASGNLTALLLGNDLDEGALTISGVGTGATQGVVIFDPATQRLEYIADAAAFDALRPGETTTDSFTYAVTDAGGLTSMATVTITITGIVDGRQIVGGGRSGNVLTGTADEDRLYGFAGNQRLDGMSGDDTLIGGAGNDTLTGGAGHDMFVINIQDGADVITDYAPGEDAIDLAAGLSIVSHSVADTNGDTIADLTLSLKFGGSVTLLGISDIGQVTFA